ncbi:MAG TPA: hypothetical protein VIY73_15085, partial [Polyangiaceae bacterium]
MAARKRRRTAFVPRLLVRTAVASVIPACALVGTADGCGSSSAPSQQGPSDAGFEGVADIA